MIAARFMLIGVEIEKARAAHHDGPGIHTTLHAGVALLSISPAVPSPTAAPNIRSCAAQVVRVEQGDLGQYCRGSDMRVDLQQIIDAPAN